jgi:hypothetical protein
MTKNRELRLVNRRQGWVAVLLVLGLIQVIGLGPALAQEQEEGQVQELTGLLAQGSPGVAYLLPDLEEGQTLYVYMNGASRNLDSFVGLVETGADLEALGTQFTADVNQAILEEKDPVALMPEFADQYFLAWDDDSGEGYAAAFEYTVPADGDYHLVAVDAPFTDTFGEYRLLIGLDAPQVLTGQATPTGDTIAILQEIATAGEVAVQEITGTMGVEKGATFFILEDVKAGDTFYAHMEATSGDVVPILVLRDFGGKPVASGNVGGQASQATLQYTFEDAGRNYRLDIESGGERVEAAEGRLLVGVNAPEVLTGAAESVGRPVLKEPLDVKVGVKLQQITGIDQKAENYGAVVSLTMEWDDPSLAFSPDSCNCRLKNFTQKDFDKFIALTGGRWPEFTLFNQQNNRWIQNRLAVVEPDGHVTYFERFTTTFQAPDFDFRQFPFDTQQFFIRVDSLFPEEVVLFSDLTEFTEVGDQLGEEEFYVTDSDTQVTSETATTGNITSRYSFRFEAKRHLSFYVLRIFVPLGLILVVSWFTFFLRDYTKRIEVTSANLLVFVAFNFTIGSDLPRLGYLTFMDTILVAAFAFSVSVVVYSVYLKWLELNKHEDRAQRIDRFMIWIYPLGYVLSFGIVVLLFFVIQPAIIYA